MAAFEQGERSQLLLEDAFAKFPGLADTNIEALRAYNEQLQTTARYDHNAIAEGEAKLAMFNFTGQQIEALTPLMEDFADKTGMGLTEAATAFGKAMIGQGRALKQVGINFHDTGSQAGNYAELLDSLTQKVGGFAEKEGQTAAGQTAILKNEVEDLKEKIGAGLVPVLLKVVPPLMQILEYLNKNSATVLKVATVVGTVIGIIWLLNAAVRAYTAVQIALNIAMSLNPVGLIIIGIAALIAVFVLLWTHSAGFRNFFIGLWNDIWGFLKAVGAWFAGPFVDFFVGAWDFLKGLVVGYYKFLFHTFDSIVDYITSLPGRIAAAAVGMWDGIVAAFKAAVNWLIRLWNDFHLTLGGGSILGMNIPSITLNTPDLPYLDRGGLITSTGLAVVHKGETVVPAGRAASGGGAVTVSFDFRGIDSDMAKALRKMVRVQGGGSVQTAFGS